MSASELRRLVTDAPLVVCTLLDPVRGPLEPPIRSEVFGRERFAQHGRSLAETHEVREGPLRRRAPFFPRLRDNIAMLRVAHRYIGDQARTGYQVSPAAEWLLDNFHLIEAQLKEILDGLPRRYFRHLPVLSQPPLAGLPRVYGVAWAFVAHTDGAFDDEMLEHFLNAYQDVRPLTLGELWALPTTLRVVLVENLRRLAERLAVNKAARELANLVGDRLEQFDTARLDDILALLNQRGVGRVFLVQMAQRLQDHEARGLTRLHDWLTARLPDVAAAQVQQPADQVADNLSVSNAIGSLRLVGNADWSDIIARTSLTMQLMLTSPAFAAERGDTRDTTLHAIERLARRCGRPEAQVTQSLLDRMHSADAAAQASTHWLQGPGRSALLRDLGLHVGIGDRLRALRHRIALPAYLLMLVLGTLGVVAWMSSHHDTSRTALILISGLLMCWPASEAVIAVINRIISESTRPRPLPRLALTQGIPPEHQVMVVVPAMLTSADAARELAHRLELHYVANPERHAQFALLSDWPDAPTASQPQDAALLDAAVQAIAALNARYPVAPGDAPRFIVLHRPRVFSATQQCYIGWERKRGKLEQLIRVLAEPGSASPFVDLGVLSRIDAPIPYIVTLDSDTELPPGRLRELVAVAAHPHNHPQVHPRTRTVVAGYGILQPHVATPLPSRREVTPFHWLFAGHGGIDPYSSASSEVYHDLFHEGSFSGKGLLHVQAMHAVLNARLPDGCILSHDLFEGSLARCAAVTDVSVIEDAPFHADVAASRVHRWTRGDWQLLPFLLRPSRYPLCAINRWKMLDNLRRSLVAPASLAWLLLVLASGIANPLVALTLIYLAFAGGPLMGAVAGLAPSRDDIAKRHFYASALLDLLRALCSGLWQLAQLLRLAISQLDAVARALYRMTVSRRDLLEWTTAAAAQSSASTDARTLWRAHAVVPITALALWLALLLIGTPHPAWSTLLCALWAASPGWTWWASRPRPMRAGASLPAADRALLEGIARDTWRLFERCVGPDDRHLPPDNLQTTPQTMVAHRTSPTNIGMYLLSAACARRFGWIGTQELIARLEATLATLATLPRHRGHFLNWYDTQSAVALHPQYVSTVDSGNLSGTLLAVAQACREFAQQPDAGDAARRAIDASAARMLPLRAALDARPDSPLDGLLAAADPLATMHADPAAFATLLDAADAELAGLLPDDADAPGIHARAAWCAADHLATLRSAWRDATAAGHDAAPALCSLATRCEALAWEPDYAFLYHRKRRLLHIGYRVAEQQLDSSLYDLLASESRLTSLLAIAKGDVPVSHWAALGRPYFAVGTNAALRSWSGSMFEYLMPTLLLHEPHGSVLAGANQAALDEQVAYGRKRGVPWGISESAYAGSDHTLAYQYAPQGVPRLALRRTPLTELVIAPYATALAAQIAPHRAAANFRALDGARARERYGYIEAIDYTPARQSGTEHSSRVETFMAHHQGMSIVSIANVLLDAAPRRWAMRTTALQAVGSLLHERAPREVSVLLAPPLSPPMDASERRLPGMLREVVPGMNALSPTHLLSNGRYSVSLRANGAGWSRWGDRGLTRSRDDLLRDAHGWFFHLRWDRRPHAVSLTQHPAPDATAHYQSSFQTDRVRFDAAWPELESHVTVWVSPEDDVEFRSVELRNLGDRALTLELMSAFEVTLAPGAADEAHPAFSNMFVRAHWQAAQQALRFERKPRLPTEPGLQLALFLARSDPERITSLRVQTQRLQWSGRNHAPNHPRAHFPREVVGHEDVELDTGLDPVCALSAQVQLEARGTVKLVFALAASDRAETLAAVIDKYRHPAPITRSSKMSATLTGIRLRELNLSVESYAAIQDLTTAIVATLASTDADDDAPARTAMTPCDRRALWRFGISGHRPIVLVSASAPQGIGLLRTLGQALRLWSWAGVACDLVVINAEPNSYLMALERDLAGLREQVAVAGGTSSGGFHVLRAAELSALEVETLRSLARVHFNADGRPLTHHVAEWIAEHEAALEQRQAVSVTALPVVHGPGTELRRSAGRFMGDSSEFHFDVSVFQRPARPWVNVLANPTFGAQLTEAGGGYTWGLNSRLNQLTPWSNDAVADPPGEWFLLQDMRTRELWSVTPSWGGDATVTYRVTHGQGLSRIRHRRADLDVSATWCVDPDTSVKQVRIRLINRGRRTARLRVIGMAEWIMGGGRADRSTTSAASFTQRLQAHGAHDGSASERRVVALTCTQRDDSGGFGRSSAFLAVTDELHDLPDWSCDRRECFDARGRLTVPDQYGQRDGHGLDPCAVIATRRTLASGESGECVFLLGHAADPEQARQLAVTAASVPAQRRIERAIEHWNALLGATVVTTPDPLFDAMVNRWLLYQTLACRLWAKAGFYQAGGAFGYRDQLQDAMALGWAAPALLREQIVLNASRQFAQGDVQHWWHAPTGAGVRTHFSDDLLWLPLACAHYVRTTGDRGVLDVAVPFLEGAPIPPGAEDAYYVPTTSAESASVYEHAARTIDHSLRVGVHGLPLMGTGDWNDGMNRVGAEGRGESVWLAWFLCSVVEDFAPLALARGDADRAHRWQNAAAGWRCALLGPAWDGGWFKRAFFDDGSPLGSHLNAECRIDLIAQAWAVISKAAPAAMGRIALDALEMHLVDAEAGLLRLLTPPLQDAQPSAGYIQAYPRGVRENGGQYSHAGVWALIAQAMCGQGDAAYRYFTYLSPAHRAAHATRAEAYEIEPYVMAGDIYGADPYVGRGGWSWYTGSAAWMHRAAIEHLFGLRLQGDSISFEPCLPSHWEQAEITLHRGGRALRVLMCRPSAQGAIYAARRGGAVERRVGESWAWDTADAPSFVVLRLDAAASAPAAVAPTRESARSAMIGS